MRRLSGLTDRCLGGVPVVATAAADALPVAAMAVWVLLVAVVLWGTRRHRRPRLAGDGWLGVATGPVESDQRPLAAAASAVGPPSPGQVVAGDTLPALGEIGGLTSETAQLDDLVGGILSAGRRTIRRAARAVLVHGDPGSGRTALVRALAGEHDAPLLVVEADDLVATGIDSHVAAVFSRARALARCVVLVSGVDRLSATGAGVDATARRRAVNDLASHVRSLTHDDRVVVVATADTVDDVSPLLLCDGCFDRDVAILRPDREERERIVRREMVFAGVTYDGDLSAVVRMTQDMTSSQVRRLVGAAVRSAQVDLGTQTEPVRLTLRDMRAGLYLSTRSTFDPSTLDVGLSRRVRRFARRLDDPSTSDGLALVGEDGNGKTTVARWLADTSVRDVVWLTGDDLHCLAPRDLEAIVDSACAPAPSLVVIDDLDADVGHRVPPVVGAKHVAVAIERLLSSAGTSVVVTVTDRSSVPNVDEARIDALWIPRPGYHERVCLLRQLLGDAELVDTTLEQLAAALHGYTRAMVVAACHRALRGASVWAAEGATPAVHGNDLAPRA